MEFKIFYNKLKYTIDNYYNLTREDYKILEILIYSFKHKSIIKVNYKIL